MMAYALLGLGFHPVHPVRLSSRLCSLCFLVPLEPGVNLIAVHFCDGGEVQRAQVGQVSQNPELVVLVLCDLVPVQRELAQVRQLLQLENFAKVPYLIAMQVEHLKCGSFALHLRQAPRVCVCVEVPREQLAASAACERHACMNICNKTLRLSS